MTVLSIVGCKMLQDELVWILDNDSEIDNILIVENENISEFTEKLDEQHISYEILPLEKISNILEDIDKNKLSVVVNFLELQLHVVPKKLKSEVYQNIREMTPFSNGLLLFYGLCGNVLGDVEEDFGLEKDGCIVRILRDDERIVDDCIGATVGGGANYLKLLKENSKEPAFFFTPMYANSWKEFNISGYTYNSNPEEALKIDKMINDMSGYSRVAKVNTGLTYTKDFDEKIEEYAELFGYSTFEVDGNQELFEKCYRSIKDEMTNDQ
ncbi:DUF1638 domain-containing protein [Methanococcoides alaskense]|uniref:DUF1638 domain-containing protein n=1 Tax=Methanococcoides alaskense TaxID=325778 RepID=A0AA90U060_9EURY|nr:DUF1638 domain-containing protein [Methanococcoides alaskense]MDA0525718.1 DUF1638 domain-containing protein [Methanococcoides alaskense]MDR6222944.1 hypothetical protein [Methanococcoides alaskense]